MWPYSEMWSGVVAIRRDLVAWVTVVVRRDLVAWVTVAVRRYLIARVWLNGEAWSGVVVQ